MTRTPSGIKIIKVRPQIRNLQNCFTAPNKMTSEDDIKGLVSLKFLHPWKEEIKGVGKLSRKEGLETGNGKGLEEVTERDRKGGQESRLLHLECFFILINEHALYSICVGVSKCTFVPLLQSGYLLLRIHIKRQNEQLPVVYSS